MTRPIAHALLLLALAGFALASAPQPEAPAELELGGAIRQARDPVIAEHDGRYYLYTTGTGIPIRCSEDLHAWRGCGLVFFGLPAWAKERVPGATAIWAPDISHFGGRYHLYYSVSTFGSNVSAIGLATNATLDMDHPDYRWVDEGLVIASQASDDWNAIDPNIVLTPDGSVYLAFGSFWSGIKLRAVDGATGMLAADDDTQHSLAWRPEPPHAIEAPFIVHRDEHYYLFVSFDQCCRGVDSTYNVRVGRSREVTGPYLDRDGIPMLEGGGTLLVAPTPRWPGSGHNAVFSHERGDLLVYHGYDAQFGGSATLRIELLAWDADGWPRATSTPPR
jgi:arabinan endo-1,5-alpha-L-arabinosidase